VPAFLPNRITFSTRVILFFPSTGRKENDKSRLQECLIDIQLTGNKKIACTRSRMIKNYLQEPYNINEENNLDRTIICVGLR